MGERRRGEERVSDGMVEYGGWFSLLLEDEGELSIGVWFSLLLEAAGEGSMSSGFVDGVEHLAGGVERMVGGVEDWLFHPGSEE